MGEHAAAGDPLAGTETGAWLRALHESYAGPLFVFAYRALGDRATAEEVVQDTVVRAWQHADRFDPSRASLGTWLFAIARNRIIDERRRRGARPREVTLEGAEVTAAAPFDAESLDRAVEAWQVADALSRLSADHRAAIVECHYRGRTVREAAERLGVPEGTVKSRLFYGLRALRVVLEEQGVVE